jgi:putative transposase
MSDMKKTKHSEAQIVKMLQEYEKGRSVEDLCREHGVHRATFYNWKKKYSGMDATQFSELKALKEENARLKKMYAELAMDNVVLKDVLSKKF